MEKVLHKSIKNMLEKVKETFKDEPKIAEVFENCYTNTLDTTVKKMEDGTTYVITGDIPAMWLRDSVAQLRPYIILAKEDEEIRELIEGLVKRQFFCINIDPYANAFNQEANGNCWEKDETDMGPWIWERKFEIDSLCYPVQLAYLLWKNTGTTKHFDKNFVDGITKIIDVFETEMNHEQNSKYRFIRKNTFYTDTLSRDGMGALVKPDIGLIWSGFRPSDDACTYGYLIPSNMFAVVILEYIKEISKIMPEIADIGEKAQQMAVKIRNAIEKYGITMIEGIGNAFAYEVDGFGQFNIMDDANVPSLLAMEYLGYKPSLDELKDNTRKVILSERNPYYYVGEKASGIGSPHTPIRYIWHISMAIEGLTAKTKEEKYNVIKRMIATDGGKGLMHEGFNVDKPEEYTREWFSWANAMFCELVLQYCGYEIEK